MLTPSMENKSAEISAPFWYSAGAGSVTVPRWISQASMSIEWVSRLQSR